MVSFSCNSDNLSKVEISFCCVGFDAVVIFAGLYFTQDYAYRDVEGHYQIQGRKDDIVRIKGVWLQVPEMESEIVSYK